MALVTQSNSGSTFSSLLAPFTGVNNATARLLKAITAAELATLREGDMVYVESLRNYWKWLPASTLTNDDITICTPTIVGAGAGRFERLTGNESPDWKLQAAWFIDSTAANQEGDGSALSPLQSDIELVRRWGTDGAIQLNTQVTITYTQAPSTVSNFDVRILNNASLTFLGTPTITKAGTVLTAVAAQVRTPGAEVPWGVTAVGLGAADVGKLIVITASAVPANVGAYARVLKDNGGGAIRTSPFGTFSTNGITGFTQVTPVVGDTIQIFDPMVLTIGFFSLRFDTQLNALAAPTRNCFVFDSIRLDGGVGAGVGSNSGVVRSENSTVFYARCILQNMSLTGTETTSHIHTICGGGAGPLEVRTNNASFKQTGFFSTTGAIQILIGAGGSQATLGTDCYFQNAQLGVQTGSIAVTQGVAWFDRANADLALIISGNGGVVRQVGGVADWGTANAGHGLVVSSGCQYVYQTKPTINGTLGAGREAKIGGTDKLYAAVPYIEGANNAALVLAV